MLWEEKCYQQYKQKSHSHLHFSHGKHTEFDINMNLNEHFPPLFFFSSILVILLILLWFHSFQVFTKQITCSENTWEALIGNIFSPLLRKNWKGHRITFFFLSFYCNNKYASESLQWFSLLRIFGGQFYTLLLDNVCWIKHSTFSFSYFCNAVHNLQSTFFSRSNIFIFTDISESWTHALFLVWIDQ